MQTLPPMNEYPKYVTRCFMLKLGKQPLSENPSPPGALGIDTLGALSPFFSPLAIVTRPLVTSAAPLRCPSRSSSWRSRSLGRRWLGPRHYVWGLAIPHPSLLVLVRLYEYMYRVLVLASGSLHYRLPVTG